MNKKVAVIERGPYYEGTFEYFRAEGFDFTAGEAWNGVGPILGFNSPNGRLYLEIRDLEQANALVRAANEIRRYVRAFENRTATCEVCSNTFGVQEVQNNVCAGCRQRIKDRAAN